VSRFFSTIAVIWRLAKPYFYSEDRRAGRILLAAVIAIELSTVGLRKPVNELYPGDRIIELAIAKGIPFTTASDAHSHAQLSENFPRLAQKLAAFGIHQVCIFEKHQRIMRPLGIEPLL